jgi:hypothetical protein
MKYYDCLRVTAEHLHPVSYVTIASGAAANNNLTHFHVMSRLVSSALLSSPPQV